MVQVEIIAPGRGVASVATRVEEALRMAGAAIATTVYEHPLLVVDPARWYAGQPTPPPAAVLARTVGLSLAPYGSPALQDDAEVGRRLAAVCHPDARVCAHLERVGCVARHVALGCRPARADGDRDLDIASAGPATPRRTRVLAHGAPWFDDLRCAHRFADALTGTDAGALARRTHVFLDLGAEADPPPDPSLLLDVVEAGAALATERLGEWPADVARHLLRAPLETLFARAQELAREPERAAELAANAHAVLADAFPLDAMGAALADVIAEAAARAAPTTAVAPPQLSRHATDPAPLTIAQALERERERPDAAVRHGVQLALHRLRRLEQRLDHEDVPDRNELLLDARRDTQPEVSVLVPCFAAARTLPETLESVAATAAEPGAPTVEIVLVDDASPGREGAAAVAWAERNDVPIAVLRHGRNRGLPSTRNTALQHARGEFVLPLDADNALRPRGLQRLLRALRADSGAAFAYGILQEFDATGPVGLRGLYGWDPGRLRYGNYIDALALIRRDALERAGGYTPESADQPYQGYEDWDLWCRLAEDGARAVWVPEIVARYRVGLGSMAANLHLSHVAPLADMLERHAGLLR